MNVTFERNFFLVLDCISFVIFFIFFCVYIMSLVKFKNSK